MMSWLSQIPFSCAGLRRLYSQVANAMPRRIGTPRPTQMATISRLRRLSSASDAAFAASAASCAISAEVCDVERSPMQSTFVDPEVLVMFDEMPHWPLLGSGVSRRAFQGARMQRCTYASTTEAYFEDKSVIWIFHRTTQIAHPSIAHWDLLGR